MANPTPIACLHLKVTGGWVPDEYRSITPPPYLEGATCMGCGKTLSKNEYMQFMQRATRLGKAGSEAGGKFGGAASGAIKQLVDLVLLRSELALQHAQMTMKLLGMDQRLLALSPDLDPLGIPPAVIEALLGGNDGPICEYFRTVNPASVVPRLGEAASTLAFPGMKSASLMLPPAPVQAALPAAGASAAPEAPASSALPLRQPGDGVTDSVSYPSVGGIQQYGVPGTALAQPAPVVPATDSLTAEMVAKMTPAELRKHGFPVSLEEAQEVAEPKVDQVAQLASNPNAQARAAPPPAPAPRVMGPGIEVDEADAESALRAMVGM